MTENSNLHTLTHLVINDLQKAYTVSPGVQLEGLILSAMMTVKKVHDQLLSSGCGTADIDPEEYCSAI